MWMYSRYGYDELSKVLSIASLVCIALSLFEPFFYFFALALLIWTMFRTYSRNIEKRRRERERYLKIVGKIKTKCRLYKRMFKERKTHCYFKCKQCKAVIRIPIGRGEIDVGCPRCKTRTMRKT